MALLAAEVGRSRFLLAPRRWPSNRTRWRSPVLSMRPTCSERSVECSCWLSQRRRPHPRRWDGFPQYHGATSSASSSLAITPRRSTASTQPPPHRCPPSSIPYSWRPRTTSPYRCSTSWPRFTTEKTGRLASLWQRVSEWRVRLPRASASVACHTQTTSVHPSPQTSCLLGGMAPFCGPCCTRPPLGLCRSSPKPARLYVPFRKGRAWFTSVIAVLAVDFTPAAASCSHSHCRSRTARAHPPACSVSTSKDAVGGKPTA